MTSRNGKRSVNWTTGMLLTPEHFLRQDEFIEESFGWLLRNCVSSSGLLGGGLRMNESVRGLEKFDPRVEIHDDGPTLRVSVLQARGITPEGEPVEVGDGNAVRADFVKADLAGFNEFLVYLERTGDREEDATSVGADDSNPNQAMFRLPHYEVRLAATPEQAGRSLVVGKVRRASETMGFEHDGRFIPGCASLLAHSSLYNGWRRLQERLVLLAGDFAELHRTVARYAEQIAVRGVDARSDLDILAFLERAVLALDSCAYETLDPTVPPHRFFQQLERVGRRIAIALDLSVSTRLFFQTLSGADASYSALLEEERQTLSRERQIDPREDLRHLLERAEETLTRVQRLGEALEGKYLDHRINRALDSLRFLLDREGEHFYEAVATPGHPQREGDLLTFIFSQMSLTGRHEYRVVLLGDPHGISQWQVGDLLHVDLRINSAAGPSRPISRDVHCEIPGQRNFSMNFETPPEVATITGMQVTVQPGHRVRGAMLYQRRLGLSATVPAAAAPLNSSTRPSTAAAEQGTGGLTKIQLRRGNP